MAAVPTPGAVTADTGEVYNKPESLTRKQSGRFARRLAASLRDLPRCSEQKQTAREANAAWSALRQSEARRRLRQSGRDNREPRQP
jgi:hypothetical protein